MKKQRESSAWDFYCRIENRTWSIGAYFHYSEGQHLSVKEGTTWKDVCVVKYKGATRHDVRLSSSGVTKSFDLNEDKHCVPYLGSVEVYEAYAEEYRTEWQREHARLQDAMTGTVLSTNDRPIYLPQYQAQGDCCRRIALAGH
jgi:hypothetical protein